MDFIELDQTDIEKQELLGKIGIYRKQLNCFYGISRIVDKENITLAEIFHEIANLLPHSWQHSDMAYARIKLDGFEYTSKNFKISQYVQFAEITPYKKRRGIIEIFYLEQELATNRRLFLEEQILITAVAERLSKIVERKESEAKLRKTRDMTQQYIDTAGMIMIVIDKNGTIVQANLRAQHILRMSKEDLVSKNWFHHCLPKDTNANKEIEIFERILSGSTEYAHHEGYILDSHGDKHLIEWHNSIISDENGKRIGVLYSGIDITEKRRTENELKAEREKLKAIISGVNVGLSLIDRDMNIIWSNKALEQNIKDKAIQGKKCYEVYKNRGQICEKCPAVRAFQTGKLEIDQEIHVGTNNDKRIFRVSASPLLNGTDEVETVIEVLEDITDITSIMEEKDQQQQQLIQAEKMASLGQIVSSIAHEINNPISSIMLNFPIIKEFIEDTKPILNSAYSKEKFIVAEVDYHIIREKVDAFMSSISNEMGRIHKIVQGLKDFSRQEITSQKNNVNINLVIEQTMLLMRAELSKKAKKIKKILAPDLPLIKGTFYRLEQVMINILLNASHAIDKKDGEIAIVTRRLNNAVLVEISDNGCGMNQEKMNKIFEPFYTTKGNQGGTGLGLSISFNIVKEHGGDIAVSSQPGKGCTFSIYFPIP
ncbi:MAG: ATP-binding protein [bacterium]